MSSLQRITMITATLLLMAVAISVLALSGYSPWISVVGGVWWGLAPVALVFGVIDAVVPARVIRWRQTAMEGYSGYQKKIGDRFSTWTAATGPRPWDNSIARNRVRMLGIGQVVVWLVVGVVILLLPGSR
jgi:hypothetical protein